MKFRSNMKSILFVAMGLLVGFTANAQEAKKTKKKKAKQPAAAAPATTEEAAPAAATEAPAASGEAVVKEHRAPYGMAGCGLGSLIIKTNSKGPQIGAAFLNATGYQTFGITTGSSNCKLSKDDIASVEQQVFIEANLASLSKDAAQGQGEHLSAFAEILGCGQGNDLVKFNEVSKAQFNTIFKDQDSKQVLSNYLNVIHSDEVLAKSCVRA